MTKAEKELSQLLCSNFKALKKAAAKADVEIAKAIKKEKK